MAIYHLEGKIISRSHGRSSVAAAAYRSAERLLDERTGLIHDFTQKQSDLIYAEILLPQEAWVDIQVGDEGTKETQEVWMRDRQRLWNHVEAIEKRKDAQLAREFNIALPRELTVEQNIALARDFVKWEFVGRGMVADLSLHRGHGSQRTQGSQGLLAQEEQPHLNVMLSLREVTPEGFGRKVRAWNDRALLQHWREAWGELCNRHLALHGLDLRIDHRSLEAQGINLEPQIKIGPKAAQQRLARLAEHQRIAYENGQRLFCHPQIALEAITQQQSTFTHHDLARFVGRHTMDAAQFTRVYEAIRHAPEVVGLGQDLEGRERMTARTMLTLEQGMVEGAEQQAQLAGHVVQRSAQQQALKLRALSPEQERAFDYLMQPGDLVCVVGYAGTGKRYMLGSAREAWEQAGYRVQGMTLSGIAAANLEGGSGISSHTIANRLLNWAHDRAQLSAQDIVVVDEAGMLGSRQMAAVLDEVRRAHAKVILVGDTEPLQAIEAGAAFRAIAERVGFVELSEIRRQREDWQMEATKALALGQTVEGLAAYAHRDHVHGFNTKEQAITAMVEQWHETCSHTPEESQIFLAYTRVDVRELNNRARQVRREYGELGNDHVLETARGKQPFAEGDRVYFLRNEKSLAVKNGVLGMIEHLKDNRLLVRLDANAGQAARYVSFDLERYRDIDYGYAATVHKAQGVTVDRSYILASKYFDRHATYVALSRHRKGAEIYWSRDEFADIGMLNRQLSRARKKDITLDYAEVRGIRAAPMVERVREQISQGRMDPMIEGPIKGRQKGEQGPSEVQAAPKALERAISDKGHEIG